MQKADSRIAAQVKILSGFEQHKISASLSLVTFYHQLIESIKTICSSPYKMHICIIWWSKDITC